VRLPVFTTLLLASCLPSRPRAVPGVSPPATEVVATERSRCPRSQSVFEQGLGPQGGQVAIPGDDSLPTTLTVVDRSQHYELASLIIELTTPDGQRRTVYRSGSEPERNAPFVVNLSLGKAATVRIHALVHPAARDGIFAEVGICYDKHAIVTLFPDETEGQIILSDGDPSLAPGSWTVMSYEHGAPDPSAEK
jgi:hypothetical protein